MFRVPGRSQVGVCALQGKIYAVGGSDVWDCLNSVEVYNPEVDRWDNEVPMSTCRRGAGVCSFKGKQRLWNVYIVGNIVKNAGPI